MSKAYDAEEFKARANIKTRNVWFLLNLLKTQKSGMHALIHTGFTNAIF